MHFHENITWYNIHMNMYNLYVFNVLLKKYKIINA